jgi:hypothetical protein
MRPAKRHAPPMAPATVRRRLGALLAVAALALTAPLPAMAILLPVAAAGAAAGAAALFVPAVLAVSDVPAKESWFRISIDGTDAGWQRTSEARDPRGFRSESESLLRVGRDGAISEIRIRWELLESASGVPIECVVEQSTGATPTRTRAEFAADGVTVRSDGGGREVMQRLPALPRDCLGPAAMGRYVEAQRAAGAARISCTTIDPASGLGPIGIVTVPAPGERCWSTTTTIVPTPMTECLDEHGEVMRAESRLGIGTFVLTRMDRSRAQAPLPGAAAGIDVLRRSVIGVTPPADALLAAQRAAITVRARSGQLLPLPSGGAQRAEVAADGTSCRVTVDTARGSAAGDGEAADPRYRGASPIIDSDDPLIRDAVQRTLESAKPGDAARAEALRAFVHRHITGKDLASVFASASSVMRDRSGDCTEHAVLLAAMLRAAGIPSRLAAGMVYAREFAGVRGCYAWHMWTQALIDGEWRDLDATLDGRAFHAGHILVAMGAQEGASVDPAFAGMVMSVGNLSVEVESVDGTSREKVGSHTKGRAE